MESKMTKTLVLAVALITTFAIGSAEARPGRGRGHGRHGGVEKGMQRIDLSVEQREQIDGLKEKMREQAAPIREKLFALKNQARPLWSAAELDDDAIFALHKQMRALEGQLEELRLGYRIDMVRVLTPDQRAEIAKAKAERKKNRAGKGEKGQGKKGHGKKGYGKKGFDRGAPRTPATF